MQAQHRFLHCELMLKLNERDTGCWAGFTAFTAPTSVGYLKLARNPNFNSQLRAKYHPRDGSYLEKFFSWDTRKSMYLLLFKTYNLFSLNNALAFS